MTRVIIDKDQFNEFLEKCGQKTKLSLPMLAKIICVDRHTLNDWRRGKLLPSLEKLTIISEFANIPLPSILETREETWGSTKAGIVRHQKYGCTLTMKDRIKGGHKSQVARKENPEYYRLLGCNTRKQFNFPSKNNPYFAEFVGIMLGDGHIGNSGQISITLNSVADHEYLGYVVQLISQLFGHSPTYFKEKIFKAVNIYLSGKEAVDFLISSGMKVGDKVKQQVDVPDWIKTDSKLSLWCLRGLMDTDGGIFTNSYKVNGKTYVYPKTCFTNASQPLLDFVYHTLIDNGFHPNNKVPRKVWLYSQAESRRYLEVVGSSNDRLLKKIPMI